MSPFGFLVGGRAADHDLHVLAVEADLDHPVLQREGDLARQVGQRGHDGQPGGRLDGGREHPCRGPGLLVSGRSRGGEVLSQCGDVRTEFHDITMTSWMASVKGLVTSP
jgi:hypothetical protein